MNKNRSVVGLIVSILLFIVGVGVTFAAYTYSKNGLVNSKQLVGDIYMHYRETNSLTLENAMPRSSYISNKYFEFTIDGKNTTTNKDIYYDIILTHGDVPNGKTEENRILDKFLKFRLVEVVNNEETEIFNNKSYGDLTNKRIHVETIPKNTTNEVIHTYRLYTWIGNNVVIGNSENPDKDYDQTEWNNLFASIKVNSTGDFEEKYTTTPASCFRTKLNTKYTLNTSMTSEELQACVDYVSGWEWNSGETAEAFCNGSGTNYGTTFQERLVDGVYPPPMMTYFQEHNIISGEEVVSITGYDSACGSEIIIPDELPSTSYTLNTNMTSEESQACVNYLTDQWGAEEEGFNIDVGETYQAFCNGTGTDWGETFQQTLNDDDWWGDYHLEYFKEHNIISAEQSSTKYPVFSLNSESFQNISLTKITIPDNVNVYFDGVLTDGCDTFAPGTTIEKGNIIKVCGVVSDSCFTTSINNSEVSIIGYDDSCGVNVVVPNQINGYPVTEIGEYAFTCPGELCSVNLKNVSIPNSVTTIGDYAFDSNQLTSVEIPNSVTTIGEGAFSNNQLTSVNIPNSVTTIGDSAFYRNQLTSVTIGNGITSIGMSAFSKSNNSNPNLTSITINKSCNDIKNNLLSGGTNYYPWLSSSSPYMGIGGVTIYGSNNEVCGTIFQ